MKDDRSAYVSNLKTTRRKLKQDITTLNTVRNETDNDKDKVKLGDDITKKSLELDIVELELKIAGEAVKDPNNKRYNKLDDEKGLIKKWRQELELATMELRYEVLNKSPPSRDPKEKDKAEKEIKDLKSDIEKAKRHLG